MSRSRHHRIASSKSPSLTVSSSSEHVVSLLLVRSLFERIEFIQLFIYVSVSLSSCFTRGIELRFTMTTLFLLRRLALIHVQSIYTDRTREKFYCFKR